MTSPDRDLPMDLNVQFEFSGEMWPWRGPAPYHFVTVPDEVSSELRSLSSIVLTPVVGPPARAMEPWLLGELPTVPPENVAPGVQLG